MSPISSSMNCKELRSLNMDKIKFSRHKKVFENYCNNFMTISVIVSNIESVSSIILFDKSEYN